MAVLSEKSNRKGRCFPDAMWLFTDFIFSLPHWTKSERLKTTNEQTELPTPVRLRSALLMLTLLDLTIKKQHWAMSALGWEAAKAHIHAAGFWKIMTLCGTFFLYPRQFYTGVSSGVLHIAWGVKLKSLLPVAIKKSHSTIYKYASNYGRLEVAKLVILFCQHKSSHCNWMWSFFSSHSINFKVLL